MSNTIALQVNPKLYDLASIDANVQSYKDNQLDLARKAQENDLYAAKAQDELGQTNALARARFKMQKGGSLEDAAGELKGYPDLQTKLYDAFDGMTPEQFGEARKRSRAFGQAAQYVSQFPVGSPQRGAAWNKSIDDLEAAGYIDADTAKLQRESGPNDLLIDQALTVDEYVSKYAGPKSRGRNGNGYGGPRAPSGYDFNADGTLSPIPGGPADKGTKGNGSAPSGYRFTGDGQTLEPIPGGPADPSKKPRNTRADEKDAADIIDKKFKELGLDDSLTLSEGEKTAKQDEFNAFKAKIYKKYGLDPDGLSTDGGSDPGTYQGEGNPDNMPKGSPQALGTKDDPVAVQSQDEFDALPAGAYFINPADGRLLRKRQG